MAIAMVYSISFSAQEFPGIYKKLRKGKKTTYLNKLKAAHESGKKYFSGEHYAVALKYDYRLGESNLLFEELIAKDAVSDEALVEYAGTLIKQKNLTRASEVLNLITSSNYTNALLNQLKSITSYLQDKECIEYKIDENSLSTYCFTFDASDSVDPVTEHLTYTWTFDESDMKEGVTVDHCFSNSGTHSVTLGSYDRISSIKNRDTTFIISIKPPLDFEQMMKNNVVKKSITFEYKEALPSNSSLLWHFGNGIFATGKKVDFIFNRPGNYYIEFFLIPDDLAQSSLLCNSCQFFVNQNRTQQDQ